MAFVAGQLLQAGDVVSPHADADLPQLLGEPFLGPAAVLAGRTDTQTNHPRGRKRCSASFGGSLGHKRVL